MTARAARFAALRDRVRALLEGERQRLQEEIRTYPTPIPRCDQQFNHLIARRELLFSALGRLDAVASLASADHGDAWLDAFIDSSGLEAHLKLRLRAAASQRTVAERSRVAGD
jgi:hypothetical protein